MKHAIRKYLLTASAGLLCLGGTVLGVAGGAAPATAATSPCARQAPPPSYQHVVLIMMENKAFTDISGNPNAPYINSLMSQCAVSHVQAAAHPSLPNYISLTSGSTHGIHDDKNPSAHPLSGSSIFSQLNGNWRSYAESMPHACTLTNSGKYAVRHVPATYYTSVRSLCTTHVLPYNQVPNLSSAFTMITPNLTHDMHSGSSLQQEIRNGDSYLAGFLPKLFASSAYQAGRTAVIVTWDEGRGTNNVVPGIVISPSVRPSKLGTITDAGILHFTEGLLGLPPL